MNRRAPISRARLCALLPVHGPLGVGVGVDARPRRIILPPFLHLPLLVGLVGISFLVIAVADPYTALVRREASYPGRRICLTIDASNSMSSPFKTDTLKCTLSGGGITIAIDADYGMAKDGSIFGRISKVEKKGTEFGPNAGDLFTFHVRAKGDTLTLSDLGPANNADARQLVEGDYKGAAQKK